MRTLVVMALAVVAGCSTMRNTPQQDLVWDAYRACQAENRIPLTVQIDRVEPDGTYWWRAYSSAYGTADMNVCINEKVLAARRGAR